MSKPSLMKQGHFPTLIAAFLYFDASFMVWVLLGPLAPFLSDQLRLSPVQAGLLTAIPLLGGALFRPVLGIFGDRFGGRKIGLLGLTLTLIPLVLGWQFARSPVHFYGIGLLLGVAGASFAVALPLAGRWYPPESQGLVMGIAGAGNSGTLIATLLAPRLARDFGWADTFALAMIPVTLVLIAYALLAKDSPQHRSTANWREYAAVLHEPDIAWFCVFYSFTFGGFVGFASFLTIFFHDQYALSKVRAGDFTTLVILAGSFLRPAGGWLSDRVGGYRLLLILLAGAACCLTGVAQTPTLPVAVVLLFLTMALLGMGNGAIFQLVPQRFPDSVGVLTGLVGAAGGLGGFFLPFLMGAVRQRTGQYSGAFFVIGAAFAAAALILLHLGAHWQLSWPQSAIERARIFSYRTIAKAASTETAD
jgi:MFS transporter, NNP family, nitrate/nitrite transporter